MADSVFHATGALRIEQNRGVVIMEIRKPLGITIEWVEVPMVQVEVAFLTMRQAALQAAGVRVQKDQAGSVNGPTSREQTQ